MLEGSRVLVTGGAGHVGSHIVDQLLEKNVERIYVYDNLCNGKESNLPKDSRIELVKADLRDYKDLEYYVGCSNYIFHTASILLLESNENPEKAIEVNIKGTYNLLKACEDSHIRKIVFSSSASVYGDPNYIPVDETHPYNSEMVYGTTKIACEHLFKDYYKMNHQDFIGLRYYNIYGPRSHSKGAYMQIVPRWFYDIDNGFPITINGDGSQTMDMIYVSDIARANILAMESKVTNQFFNVCTGIQTSVSELAGHIITILNSKDIKINYTNRDINLVKRRQGSTKKAEELLGFKYEIGVEEGLRKYYEWRKENEV